MEFGWDPAKHENNLQDRGIGFVRAARIFDGSVVEWIDSRRDYGEVRINAIGMADGELLRVTYTMREGGRLHWIITTWKAGWKEGQRPMARRATRMTLDQVRRSKPTPSEVAEFRRRMAATTEKDIRRHMVEDGYDPDEEVREEDIISPAVIRKRLGMSQREFAEAIHVPLATLQNWEQHRTAMDPATLALMTILAREPKAALRALGKKAA